MHLADERYKHEELLEELHRCIERGVIDEEDFMIDIYVKDNVNNGENGLVIFLGRRSGLVKGIFVVGVERLIG
jgi:hypothetical protein